MAVNLLSHQPLGRGILPGAGGDDRVRRGPRGDFANPPESDRAWVYWWWLDGAASKEGITRDLEEMRRQGVGGVLLVDAGVGGPDTPKGPPFMSEPWREHFRHAVREAGRLGLRMSVNLCSGWDAGGPWIKPEDAIKRLVTSEISIQGPMTTGSRTAAAAHRIELVPRHCGPCLPHGEQQSVEPRRHAGPDGEGAGRPA